MRAPALQLDGLTKRFGDVALWPQLTGRETLELLGNLNGRVDHAFRNELIARLI